jgi:folylpolyglutamate synthase/dihydropteroate synthase
MSGENCMSLNDELTFFQNLLLDILTRRVVFRKFEDEMKKTKLMASNDMMALVWYGYVISQLSDCRKFFDRDGNAHSFQFVVRHLKDEPLRNRHTALFGIWKDKKLETVLNKYMLHADQRVGEINTEVSVKALDAFIDDLEKYTKEIVSNLNENYQGISALEYDAYLKDREPEVDLFFSEVRK